MIITYTAPLPNIAVYWSVVTFWPLTRGCLYSTDSFEAKLENIAMSYILSKTIESLSYTVIANLLFWAKKHRRRALRSHNAVRGHLWSFKVTDFDIIREPKYDFLLTFCSVSKISQIIGYIFADNRQGTLV